MILGAGNLDSMETFSTNEIGADTGVSDLNMYPVAELFLGDLNCFNMKLLTRYPSLRWNTIGDDHQFDGLITERGT